MVTVKGVVEGGRVRVLPPATLPENAEVFVIFAAHEGEERPRILTPRLVHPEQAVDFRMECREEKAGAGV
jgi:hypothetical protein